jgi:N-acetylglucosaminyl-diphospho-decaprenol L-rhamnosyltransferase
VRTPRELDVVVVTRDTRELTLRCVESVLRTAADSGMKARLVVVDNGSSDGTAEALADGFPDAVAVRNAEDAGFGPACNQGAAAGAAETILFLNSDVVARPRALERLAGALAGGPGRVAAGGRLVDPGTDRTQVGFTLRAFPRLSNQAALLVGLERVWPANPVSRRHLQLDFDYGRTHDVDAQPAGACLACRRDAFQAVGGFDEGFRYWFEDVDLVLRLRSHGAVAYVHDAVFEHVGGASFAAWPREDVVRARYRSLLRYFAKHRPRHEQVALRALVAALAGLRAGALAPTDRPRALAYADVVRLAVRGRG